MREKVRHEVGEELGRRGRVNQRGFETLHFANGSGMTREMVSSRHQRMPATLARSAATKESQPLPFRFPLISACFCLECHRTHALGQQLC